MMMGELTAPRLSQVLAGNTNTDGVWFFDSGLAGPCVLISALIHGNEICGALAAIDLIESLQKNSMKLTKGKLIVAFCNIAAFKRFDADDLHASRFVDEDMNRIWSADKLTMAVDTEAAQLTSERSRAIELLPYILQADFHLDLHSMHDPGDPLVLTGLLAKNIDFAKTLNLPAHIIVDQGHSEGVRLRDFRPETISLLVECGFHLAASSYEVAKHCTERFLTATGLIANAGITPSWLTVEPISHKAVKVTQAVVAQTAGLSFAHPWQNMQTIPLEGTLIATDGTSVFTTPYDSCTLVMPSLKQLRRGVTVVRFAQELN
jgi:predicted deacylase